MITSPVCFLLGVHFVSFVYFGSWGGNLLHKDSPLSCSVRVLPLFLSFSRYLSFCIGFYARGKKITILRSKYLLMEIWAIQKHHIRNIFFQLNILYMNKIQCGFEHSTLWQFVPLNLLYSLKQKMLAFIATLKKGGGVCISSCRSIQLYQYSAFPPLGTFLLGRRCEEGKQRAYEHPGPGALFEELQKPWSLHGTVLGWMPKGTPSLNGTEKGGC